MHRPVLTTQHLSNTHIARSSRRRSGRLLAWLAACLLWPFAALAQTTPVAWGLNEFGQADVPLSMENPRSISAAVAHTLYVRADGTVALAGDESFGNSDMPRGLSDVVAVAAGGGNLALKADGTLAAWGYLQTEPESSMPPGLINIVAIAHGGGHALALRADGTVVAWGFPSDGRTVVPAGLTGVVAIAAGAFHALALKSDGTVVAWGRNTGGESTVPRGLRDVIAIDADGPVSMALKADGTVAMWGTLDPSLLPPPSLAHVVAISAGTRHFLALRDDGGLVAWGDNAYGQGTVPPGLGGGIVEISAGGFHNVVIQRGSPPLAPPVSVLFALRNDVTALDVALEGRLLGSIDAAIVALDASKTRRACTALESFDRLARRQRGRQLTAEQSDYFIAQAADMRALVGCG